MKKVLIAGASGMIGGFVLQHCLNSDQVSSVVSLTRKRSELQHPKLREIVFDKFTGLVSMHDPFRSIDVAYFCIGVYTGAVPDNVFREITVNYTILFADLLKANSPDATMCFLSGAGADRSEKSRVSFAKYKGMAENYLVRKAFKNLYIFRPSYIYPVAKRKEPNLAYRVMRILYPVMKLMGGHYSIRSDELGKAMFMAGVRGAAKSTMENSDILDFLSYETDK